MQTLCVENSCAINQVVYNSKVTPETDSHQTLLRVQRDAFDRRFGVLGFEVSGRGMRTSTYYAHVWVAGLRKEEEHVGVQLMASWRV